MAFDASLVEKYQNHWISYLEWMVQWNDLCLNSLCNFTLDCRLRLDQHYQHGLINQVSRVIMHAVSSVIEMRQFITFCQIICSTFPDQGYH